MHMPHTCYIIPTIAVTLYRVDNENGTEGKQGSVYLSFLWWKVGVILANE